MNSRQFRKNMAKIVLAAYRELPQIILTTAAIICMAVVLPKVLSISDISEPSVVALAVCILLEILAECFRAPSCILKAIPLGILVFILFYVGQLVFTHYYVKVPDKHELRVYEGRINFNPDIHMGRSGGMYWEFVDAYGNSRRLWCASAGTLATYNCGFATRGDYVNYQNKPVIIYYSEKFGIMEMLIDDKKVYDYEKNKARFATPSVFHYIFVFIGIVILIFLVFQFFKNTRELKYFLLHPLLWRRQEIDRQGKNENA
jgi:hypothetical protein